MGDISLERNQDGRYIVRKKPKSDQRKKKKGERGTIETREVITI